MTDTLLTLLAQAPATQPQSSTPGWVRLIANPINFLLLLFVAVLLFTSSSKRKQDRQRTDMLAALKKNDEIQTIGGVIGKVMEVRDDRVLVKVDENTNAKIWFSRNAIHRVLDQKATETTTTKA